MLWFTGNIFEYSNINIAICSIVSKKTGVYHSFFDNFEPFIKENFLKNYDKILNFAKKKNTEFINKPVVTTSFYGMRIKIDYEKVIEKLKENKFLLS